MATQQKRMVFSGEDNGPVCAEGELRGVTDAVPALIAFFDPDHVCRFANAYHAIWYPGPAASAIGMHMSEILGDQVYQSRKPFLDRVMQGEQVAFDAGLPHREGGFRDVAVRYIPKVDRSGSVIGFYVINFDITERRREEKELRNLAETLEARVAEEVAEHRKTEAALVRAQKMEAIGQLTGGIAHDFNNLLQVISGNLQLLDVELGGSPAARRRISAALDGVNRGARLASQLLAFARRQALEPRVLNVARFMDEMEDILGAAIGSDIEVDCRIAKDLWNCFVDPAQTENAMLNLTINARDAMNHRGKLTIELANAELDEAYAARHEDVTPGQYVMVAVSDTGCGMSPEVIEKVFEPFFTTKPEHKGSGLGLSMVYGFVKQSGGHVNIYSEVGIGTTIRLYLPRAKQDVAVIEIVDHGPVIGGSETVLVVEDDPGVRDAAVDMLAGLGYRVLRASDAQAGLAVVESGVPVDLIFTDVVMPGPLSSAEMSERAKQVLPDVGVLFTSGYTENAICVQGRIPPDTFLLPKPYTREKLARKLRYVIEQKGLAPICDAEQASRAAGSASAVPFRPLNILLVEDDGTIRTYTAEMLVASGHSVRQADSAEEALPIIENGGIDVLVTDVNLPGMSGPALADRARAIRAGLGVVFVTGNGQGGTHCPGAVTVRKPYRLAVLDDAIRSVAAE